MLYTGCAATPVQGALLTQHSSKTRSIFGSLYFRVLLGFLAGIFVGFIWPHAGESLKPLGDGFIKLVRMLVPPIIFLTVVTGIASMGDTRKLGRVGAKALLYFEVVTTFALVLGVAFAHLMHPGLGLNIDPRVLDAKSIDQYVRQGHSLGVTGFLLNILPDSFVGAFAGGEILQVLFLSILVGVALVALDKEERLLSLARSASHLFFRMTALVMELAPLAVFGAMAFTVGKYGVATLISLGKVLLCMAAAGTVFTVVVLGSICRANGLSLWRLIVFLKEEVAIAIGTSSSEPALPGLMAKMEKLGCPPAIVGLVVPAGYSFNLDGTSIYLTIAALFVAQATNTHLTLGQEAFILLVLMLNSKGAATVTGGGFITLAATLSALGTIPVAGITLLLGIDRFMSQMRTLVNLIGNAVACIVVSRWENGFDQERAKLLLKGHVFPAHAGPVGVAEEEMDSVQS
jgi:aerobic C4-dicarboxylate transport protein